MPINVIQRVMSHANASTTLNRYTHAPADYADRVRAAFEAAADDPPTFPALNRPDDDDDGGAALP